MICPHCGSVQRDDARFCGACGRATLATEPADPEAVPPVSPMIGREIAGRYRMLAKLGEGGMGTVYRAEQMSLKRTVAVKLLRPDVVSHPLVLRRFNAEAEAVAKLSHPNTVNIYDFGQDPDGTLFIAMEYIEGRSLRAVMQAEAPLSPRRALAIALQVVASLSDAHARSIVHRDLKPDNVMLQDRGKQRDVVRVLDFGIAKLRDDSRASQLQMTQQGDMLGTPQYMAPEQIRAEPIDGRTDVYALGCLLYEMVTARLPYEAPTVLAILSKHLLEAPVPPSQRRPELALPPSLDALILGAMAKDPRARPATMDQLGEQIAALYAALPPDAGPRADRAASAPVVPPAVAGGYTATPYEAMRMQTPGVYPAAHQPMSVSVPAPTPAPLAYAPTPNEPYTPAQVAPRARPAHAPFGSQAGRSRKPMVLAIVAVVAVGGGITALVIANRDDAPLRDTPAIERNPPREQRDPWASGASEAMRATPAGSSDHWATQPSVAGTKVGVGQGVELIVPLGFRTSNRTGATIAIDNRNVVIAAAPIAIASDDPKQLADYHARSNGVTLDSIKEVFVGGVARPMAVFHGTIDGVAIRQVVVPLISPRYRIAVALQAPAELMTADSSMQALAFELFTQRIILP